MVRSGSDMVFAVVLDRPPSPARAGGFVVGLGAWIPHFTSLPESGSSLSFVPVVVLPPGVEVFTPSLYGAFVTVTGLVNARPLAPHSPAAAR